MCTGMIGMILIELMMGSVVIPSAKASHAVIKTISRRIVSNLGSKRRAQQMSTTSQFPSNDFHVDVW